MTPLEHRQRIAKALDSIGQVGELTVHGYDAQPDNPTAGAAWPVYREFTPGVLRGPSISRTYDVYAIVRSSHARVAAEDAENLTLPLLAALHPLGDWTPPGDTVQIQVADGQVMPALHLRITPYD